MMNKKFVSKSLYKYCDVSNFRFFVDILLNNQLYGAKYDELNDPFEGILFSRTKEMSESVAGQRWKLHEARKNYRSYSLSKVHDDNRCGLIMQMNIEVVVLRLLSKMMITGTAFSVTARRLGS